jgi:hypothetical protein
MTLDYLERSLPPLDRYGETPWSMLDECRYTFERVAKRLTDLRECLDRATPDTRRTVEHSRRIAEYYRLQSFLRAVSARIHSLLP